MVDKSQTQNAATGKTVFSSKKTNTPRDHRKKGSLQSREDTLETDHCSCSGRLTEGVSFKCFDGMD